MESVTCDEREWSTQVKAAHQRPSDGAGSLVVILAVFWTRMGPDEPQ